MKYKVMKSFIVIGIFGTCLLIIVLSFYLSQQKCNLTPAEAIHCEEYVIYTDPYYQADPIVDNDFVVWVDCRDGLSDLYAYDILTGETNALCKAKGIQGSVYIHNDLVVWDDNRNGNKDIYAYDRRTQKEFPVCIALGIQMDPVTNGNLIVWMDARNDDDGKFPYQQLDIYGYDLNAKKEIPIRVTSGNEKYYPVINQSYVVWIEKQKKRDGIFGYEIKSGKVFCLRKNLSGVGRLALNNEIVVWDDYRHKETRPDIYGYNIISKEEFPICIAKGRQVWPSLDGDIVVWMDGRFGNDDVFGLNLNTMKKFPIRLDKDDPCYTAKDGSKQWDANCFPIVKDRFVIWVDRRTPEEDIYGYDLITKQQFPVVVAPGRQYQFSFDGKHVVWVDQRSGGMNIYGAELKISPK